MQELENTTRRERSASYPAINLEKAIQSIQKIKSNLGKGPFSRGSAARALGYSGISGKSATVVAALVHYGLLTRKADTYMVSELSDELITYKDERERKAAIVKAATHPSLYIALFKSYEGRSLPAMLDHILVRDYGIREKVASAVGKDFKASMTFAKLLTNGVLGLANPETHYPSKKDTDEGLNEPRTPPSNGSKVPPPALADMQQVEIIDGVILSYRSDLALEILTSHDFSTSLQKLRDALEPLEETQKEREHDKRGQDEPI